MVNKAYCILYGCVIIGVMSVVIGVTCDGCDIISVMCDGCVVIGVMCDGCDIISVMCDVYCYWCHV